MSKSRLSGTALQWGAWGALGDEPDLAILEQVNRELYMFDLKMSIIPNVFKKGYLILISERSIITPIGNYTFTNACVHCVRKLREKHALAALTLPSEVTLHDPQ